MKMVYLRPMMLRLPQCMLMIFCSIVAPIAALLALTPRPVNQLIDMLPALMVGLVLLTFCVVISARSMFWGYAIVNEEILVRGLFWTRRYSTAQVASIERFEKWEREHNPPRYLFGGYVVRDRSGYEMFRVTDIVDFDSFKQEIDLAIKRNGPTYTPLVESRNGEHASSARSKKQP